jgi:hypothetical protein
MVRRWRLIGYFPILTFFDSAQCLMVRRWRLIGHFPILYNPQGRAVQELGVRGAAPATQHDEAAAKKKETAFAFLTQIAQDCILQGVAQAAQSALSPSALRRADETSQQEPQHTLQIVTPQGGLASP